MQPSRWILLALALLGALACGWFAKRGSAVDGARAVQPDAPPRVGASVQGPGAVAVPAPGSEREAIDARPRGRILGSVTDVAGRPMGGEHATVRLQQAGGIARIAQVSPDGRFEAGGLDLGRWSLRSSAFQHVAESLEVDLSGESPEAEAAFVLFAARTVAVRLCDERGAPLAQRLSELALDFAHAPSLEIREEGQPRRRVPGMDFTGPGGGSLVLRDSPATSIAACTGGRTFDARSLAEAGAAERIDLRVDLATLRALAAQVRLRCSEPLPHLSILTIEREDGAATRHRIGPGPELSLVLPPGRIALMLECPGLARERLELALAPGDRHVLAPIRLEPAQMLVGTIRDADGAPLDAALVVLRRTGPTAWEPAAFQHPPRAFVSGRFVLDGLHAGEHSIACATGGPAVSVTLPRAEPLEIRGERAPISSARAASPPRSR